MNHLVIQTHFGANVDLLVNQLMQDHTFFHFWVNEDRQLFLDQYNRDLSDGLVINPIDDTLFSEENWPEFYKNAFEHLNLAYGVGFNRFLIHIVYGKLENVNFNEDVGKRILFLREPHFAWNFMKYFSTPLKDFCQCFKYLCEPYNDPNIVDESKLNYQDFISANEVTMNKLRVYLESNFTADIIHEFDLNNIYMTSHEIEFARTVPMKRYTYNYFFNDSQDAWDELETRLSPELETLGFNTFEYNTFDSLRKNE